MNLRGQKSQSTTEYLIVMTVIVAALLVGIQLYLKSALAQMMNNIGKAIEKLPDKLKGLLP